MWSDSAGPQGGYTIYIIAQIYREDQHNQLQ